VSITFSYEPDNDLERPYQALMLLFIVSTYVMIIQYLQIVPEYMHERAQLYRDYSLRNISYGPSIYIIAALLTEVPRSVVQSAVLLSVVYFAHPLNPTPVNILFTYVGCMVGTCAWQSLICLCCAITDAVDVANTLCFLVLGSGTLFGGLLVRFSKIPVLFKPFYFLSVISVTQRALIVNDLECCYMTSTCNSVTSSLRANAQLEDKSIDVSSAGSPNSTLAGNTFCPPGLAFSGDGSDEGNLGRLYLNLMGLDFNALNNPFIGLLILFVFNVLFRIAATLVLHHRFKNMYQLRD
jgi:hypothetical protein